jgi:hypothetical protein
LRRTYRDGKRHRIEELLNDFKAGTAAYATAEKLRREEHERWQREWAEKEMRRIEEQQRIERDKKRWEFLEDRIRALERVSEDRSFFGAPRIRFFGERATRLASERTQKMGRSNMRVV